MTNSERETGGMDRLGVTAVTWVDDDGTQYKRVERGGEIVDVPVRWSA